MEIFGEKYSKEKYDKAAEKAKLAEHVAQSRGTITGTEADEILARHKDLNSARGGLISSEMFKDPIQEIYNKLWDNAAKAKARVETLYAKSQKEAMALNKEHEQLQLKAQEAVKVLEDFEREKLGMHT